MHLPCRSIKVSFLYRASRNVDVNVVKSVGMLIVMDFGRIFGTRCYDIRVG